MKIRKSAFVIVVATALFALVMATSHRIEAQAPQPAAGESQAETPITSKALAAIESAASEDKYLFIYFWKTNDVQSENMNRVFKAAMEQWEESANSIAINITDADEKPAVDRFGVSRAPMPLVIALAPNGAITKGLPIEFNEEQLEECFVSQGMANCMKALQDRKLILLCVQNDETQFGKEALLGAQNFHANERYANASEIVLLNPEDEAEAAFLKDLRVDPETSQAVTLILAPTGQLVASFEGVVTTEQIIAKVEAGPCADGGCGPSGCCP